VKFIGWPQVKMSELRAWLIPLVAKLRYGHRSPETLISGSILTLGLIALTIGLVWTSSLEITAQTAQLIVYVIALFETLLGLRVGMLRIGYRADEYMISPVSRFWRRAASYLIPAAFLPLPLIIALASHLGGSGWYFVVAVKILVLNALMFFGIGAVWGVLIRRVTRQLLARALLLVMSIIAVFSISGANWSIFDPAIIFSLNPSAYLSLLVFELAISVVAFAGIDLLIGQVTLTNRHFGRYYPIFTTVKALGSGSGSTSFYLTVKAITRDSFLHRRLAIIIFSSLILTGLLYAYRGWLSELSIDGLLISLFAVFSAVLAYVLSGNVIKQQQAKLEVGGVVANKSAIAIGTFLAGLLWMVMIGSVFWGIIDTTFGASSYLIVFVIAAINQFILAYGWAAKLAEAAHQSVAALATFGGLVLIGLVPAMLWSISSIGQIVFTQLIWLVFTVILLQITASRTGRQAYA
jgi:hypothetical protein